MPSKVANAKVPWKVLRKEASSSELLKNLPQDLSQNLTMFLFRNKNLLRKHLLRSRHFNNINAVGNVKI
jgi:hypothetical protein